MLVGQNFYFIIIIINY